MGEFWLREKRGGRREKNETLSLSKTFTHIQKNASTTGWLPRGGLLGACRQLQEQRGLARVLGGEEAVVVGEEVGRGGVFDDFFRF
jgi:hypothetical protein